MKAQIRTFETIVAIFVFFILLSLGIMLYWNASKGAAEKESEKNLELRALNIAEQIQSLPELQCSTNNIAADRCFEEIKLDKIKELKTDYFDAFGFSDIHVVQIYPALNPGSWKIYSNPKNNFKSNLSIQIPATIHDNVDRENKFGMLMVNAYD